jgi:hypothetical protein
VPRHGHCTYSARIGAPKSGSKHGHHWKREINASLLKPKTTAQALTRFKQTIAQQNKILLKFHVFIAQTNHLPHVTGLGPRKTPGYQQTIVGFTVCT